MRSVLQNPDRWVEADVLEGFAPFPSFALRYPPYLRPYGYLAIDQAVDRYMQERNLDNGDVIVESVSYHNPLELIVSVGTVGFVILKLVSELRDWPARRRMNNTAAAEFEDTARARRKIRSALVERIVSGEQPIPLELIDSLLTDGVVESFRALTRADMQVEELEQSPSEAGEQDQS